MPLSPIKQALRRDRLNGGPNPGRLPKDPPKVRCKNCPKFFLKNRPNKEFHSTECKNEFNRNGGTAYAQLKTKVEKLVRNVSRDAFAGLEKENRDLSSRFETLLERFNTLLLAVTVMDGQIQKLESKTLPLPSQPTK
jgi:hypothetical protein